MNVMLFGPQGSGKGTQAELLERYGFAHLDMGQLLRQAASSETDPLSESIRNHQLKGVLVPDEIVFAVTDKYLNTIDDKGIVFDGFPRNIEQYEKLKDLFLKHDRVVDKVLFLDLSENETIHRILSRRTCSKCGRVYNLVTNPSPNGEECECGGELTVRVDDTREKILVRLNEYKEKTMPILNKAKEEGLLVEINGEQPIDVIHNEIVRILGLKND